MPDHIPLDEAQIVVHDPTGERPGPDEPQEIEP